MVYLDCIIDATYGRYQGLLLQASEFGPAVPRWPGMPKYNDWGYLNDFRAGSVLERKLEGVLERMVAENPHMGGWFADDLGTRPYPGSFDWTRVPTSTQQAYRDGAIALSKIFRRVADRHGLIFLVNGTWAGGSLPTSGGGYPDMMQHGCSLADGGVIEHHEPNAFQVNYATSAQWATQSAVTRGTSFQFAIARTDEIRDQWRTRQACAFAVTQNDYGRVPAPYSRLSPAGLPSRVAR